MLCDPNSLVDQAKCISCNVPPGMYLPILVYLFCTIANLPPSGGGASCLLCSDVDPTAPPPNNCPCAITYNVRPTAKFFYWTGSAWQVFH